MLFLQPNRSPERAAPPKTGWVYHAKSGQVYHPKPARFTTKIGEVRGEWVRVYEVTPEQFGLSRAPLSEISGGDLHQNATIIRDILGGRKSARRDVVLMNAAAALVAAGRADSLAEAMPLAINSLDSGSAQAKLNALVEFTNRQ